MIKDGRGWQLGSQWVAHSPCSNLYWQKYNREPSDRKTKNCPFEILTFHGSYIDFTLIYSRMYVKKSEIL